MFKNKKKNVLTSSTIINYPIGMLLICEDRYYLVTSKGYLRILTERMANSWNLTAISTDLLNIELKLVAGAVGFRDGTLIKNIDDGKMYLISGSKRRHIRKPEWLVWLNLDKPIWATVEETELHEIGDDLS